MAGVVVVVTKKLQRSIAAVLLLVFSAVVIAETTVGYHVLRYVEGDDRVKVTDHAVSIKGKKGVDYDYSIDLGYDAISGASPTLRSKTPTVSADDSRNRIAKLDAARKVSNKLILGYDPNGEYQVEKVDLTDIRRSINLSLTSRDELRNETTVTAGYSKESDYSSSSISASKLWWADRRKNRSYTLGGSYIYNESYVFNGSYADQIIDKNYAFDIEAGINQTLSASSTATVSLFASHDSGYLSNHYQTILRAIDVNRDGVIDRFNEVFLAGELRPEKRVGKGVNASWIKQWDSWITSQLGYRFFDDDWGITSHTMAVNLDVPFYGFFGLNKPKGRSAQWSLLPAYRYYSQSQAFFYKNPYAINQQALFGESGPASSDERLSEFVAHRFELGAQYPVIKSLTLDFSVAHYFQQNSEKQNSDFSANWLMLGVSYKHK